MPKLLLFLQDGSAREVLFERDTISVGRRHDNDVPLPYPTVSGRHALFTFVPPDQCYVEDQKSTNGTLVNGQLVVERKLIKDRDQIDVGGQKFVYLEGAPVSHSAAHHHPPTGKAAADPKQPLRHEPMGAMTSTPSMPMMTTPMPTKPTPGEDQFVDDDEGDSYSGLHFPTIFRIPSKPKTSQEPTKSVESEEPEYAVSAVADGGALLEEATYNMPAPVAMIEALSGPNSQRKLMLRPGEYVLGRPGFQLAVVRVSDEGCRLIPMEGEPPLKMGEQTVAAEGVLLKDQDKFTVGNSPLQFRVLPGQKSEDR